MAHAHSKFGEASLAAAGAAAIGAAIREVRKAYGLTQSQLAGTGLRFISGLERGKPNVSTLPFDAKRVPHGSRLDNNLSP